MSLEEMRRQYTKGGLLEEAAAADPWDQFSAWMNDALEHAPADWVEPYAMTLATSNCDGIVSARVVLLRGYGPQGMVFYTNYESPKGMDLAENPQAALLFYWGYLERQVRISGSISKVDRTQSDYYFHKRPRGSQISASISRQSEVVPNRAALETAANNLDAKLAGGEVPLPDFWGGYCLAAARFEFWQGREDRLHDRLLYTASQGAWCRQRLSP